MCVWVILYVCLCFCLCLGFYICICVSVCVYVCVCVRTCVCMCVCVLACVKAPISEKHEIFFALLFVDVIFFNCLLFASFSVSSVQPISQKIFVGKLQKERGHNSSAQRPSNTSCLIHT